MGADLSGIEPPAAASLGTEGEKLQHRADARHCWLRSAHNVGFGEHPEVWCPAEMEVEVVRDSSLKVVGLEDTSPVENRPRSALDDGLCWGQHLAELRVGVTFLRCFPHWLASIWLALPIVIRCLGRCCLERCCLETCTLETTMSVATVKSRLRLPATIGSNLDAQWQPALNTAVCHLEGTSRNNAKYSWNLETPLKDKWTKLLRRLMRFQAQPRANRHSTISARSGSLRLKQRGARQPGPAAVALLWGCGRALERNRRRLPAAQRGADWCATHNKGNQSNRVCNALALLQCVASHQETRALFLQAHIPLFLYPVRFYHCLIVF